MADQMITRIVKLTFRPEEISNFKTLFFESHELISAFEGCKGVQLQQDADRPEVFFTVSSWNSLKDLENYRSSDLFNKVWAQTKVKFADKPEAWSLNAVSNV